MKGVARDNLDFVDAIGFVGNPLQTMVFTNGFEIAIQGEKVAPHPPFPENPIHGLTKMVEASTLLFINGKGVCRQGDKARCGHTVVVGDTLVFSD
ncbi:MAG TPA: PAAR domain-containing protein [Saccharofermentans sp.]|nr:PAAR domain-containing protein [Saccharofermentans sp.]